MSERHEPNDPTSVTAVGLLRRLSLGSCLTHSLLVPSLRLGSSSLRSSFPLRTRRVERARRSE